MYLPAHCPPARPAPRPRDHDGYLSKRDFCDLLEDINSATRKAVSVYVEQIFDDPDCSGEARAGRQAGSGHSCTIAAATPGALHDMLAIIK